MYILILHIYKCNSDAFEKSLLDKTWLHDESFMNVAFKPHIKNLVQKELKSLETFFKTVCRSMCIGWEGVGGGGSRQKIHSAIKYIKFDMRLEIKIFVDMLQ